MPETSDFRADVWTTGGDFIVKA